MAQSSGFTNRRGGFLFCLLLLSGLVSLAFPSAAQELTPSQMQSLSWRLIGPFRGGRVSAVAGISGDPKTYYMGTPGGGVWKTTNGGVSWTNISDNVHLISIGDLVVAPSAPATIYVATGEQFDGNGVWKSTDAGANWSHIGLRGSRVISSLLVDPHDANIVYAAAVGESTPEESRGIYKTTDGGASWRKVYYKDEWHSPTELCFDPGNSKTIFAVVRRVPAPPKEDAASEAKEKGKNEEEKAPDTFIVKSTDAGESWTLAGEQGLPANERGRIGIAVAPGFSGKRVFALMNQGLFRSDDGGSSWRQITDDPRILGSTYFGRVYSDPRNPEVVYVMQTSTYRSSDGGRTFSAWKGTPSGEDDHVLWIAPEDSSRILMGTDQGAVITLDGGKSWSSWYNQPTGQFYRVTTDRSFPYRLYAAQQDSGSVSVASRTDYGLITYRDWFPAGAFESSFIAPDPLNAHLIYTVGWYGIVQRLNRATGQVATVFIPPANYHPTWETPIVFSPKNPHVLYYGAQFVLKTADGGLTWKEVSGDLTRKDSASPAAEKASSVTHGPSKDSAEFSLWDEEDSAQKPKPGAIQAIAPSPLDANLIWEGSTTGLIHVTRDGSSWTDVTPANLPARAYINSIEASAHDPATAFTAVFERGGAFSLHFGRRDSPPLFLRTRDFGKTWESISAGLPEASKARVIREDTVRKGLLFAGTNSGVYFSLDSGDHWQSLQRNLPATPVTDIAIHGSDLAISTYGRGLWILDDISALRQWPQQRASGASDAPVHLFTPEPAVRVRWDNYPDTPLQPDTPAALNPADGAVVQFFQPAAATGEITLDIFDPHGGLVRHFTSRPAEESLAPANVPEFWFAPPAALPNQSGINRFVWDLRYPHPSALPFGYYGELLKYTEYTLPDHAVPSETPRRQPPGPLAAPGDYELVLTREGKTYREKLRLLPDPRVGIRAEDYEEQLALSRKVTEFMEDTAKLFRSIAALQSAVAGSGKQLPKGAPRKLTEALGEAEKSVTALLGGEKEAPGIGLLNGYFSRQLVMLQSADIKPGESAYAAVAENCGSFSKDVAAWNKLNAETIPALNKLLAARKAAALPVAAAAPLPVCGR